MATPGTIGRPAPETASQKGRQLVRRAGEAFDDYLKALGNKEFDTAARALSDLENLLEELSDRFGETVPIETPESRGD